MSKKYSIVYLLTLCLLMSVVLGFVAPSVMSGAVTPEAFFVVFGLSMVLTVVLGLVLPLHKISVRFCELLHQDPQSGLGKLFANACSATLLMLFITFVMVGIVTGFGEVDGTNYIGRVVSGIVSLQPILVIIVMFLDPLATVITRKLVREAPATPES
jgi:hypothetical protein